MSEAIRQMFRENVVAVRRFRSALAAAYSYEVFKLNGRTVLQVAHAARARQHAAVVAGSCALVLRQLGKDDVDIDVYGRVLLPVRLPLYRALELHDEALVVAAGVVVTIVKENPKLWGASDAASHAFAKIFDEWRNIGSCATAGPVAKSRNFDSDE